MRPIEQIHSRLQGSIKDKGDDGGNGIYSTCGIVYAFQFSFGGGWEHASISIVNKKRCPTWEEMCMFKDVFWAEDEAVMQFHPPKSKYVNTHKYCLHLWKPIEQKIPAPPVEFV